MSACSVYTSAGRPLSLSLSLFSPRVRPPLRPLVLVLPSRWSEAFCGACEGTSQSPSYHSDIHLQRALSTLNRPQRRFSCVSSCRCVGSGGVHPSVSQSAKLDDWPVCAAVPLLNLPPIIINGEWPLTLLPATAVQNNPPPAKSSASALYRLNRPRFPAPTPSLDMPRRSLSLAQLKSKNKSFSDVQNVNKRN